MAIPKYKDLENFNSIEDIENEILNCKKKLLELNIEKVTYRSNKSHLFSHLRRRIAQLKFKQSSLAKTMKLY